MSDAQSRAAPAPAGLIDHLLTRRSSKPAVMGEPGPDAADLQRILTAAARVPDHKKLAPWRFVVFQGEARARFGEVIAAACAAEEKEPPSPSRLETERTRFLRAPLVVAVVSRVRPVAGAPEWEQVLSCGAACMNLCHAANALGFATSWVTEWYAYSPRVTAALGLTDGERVAGFIYVGTAKERLDERERPALADVASYWTG